MVWKGNKENFDSMQLRKWGKQHMAHYQIPLVFVCLTEPLPRNHMGKVNKKELVKIYFPNEENS